MSENELVTIALKICFDIHKKYGPGLLEHFYEELFCYEWQKTGIPFQRQQGISVIHENVRVDIAFRADVILDKKVLLEFKSIECFHDKQFKTVNTYLRITGIKLGVLINFNTSLLKEGIKRVVNNL